MSQSFRGLDARLARVFRQERTKANIGVEEHVFISWRIHLLQHQLVGGVDFALREV